MHGYSTASTSEAAYIIGGRYTMNIIAEFKDGSWRQMGTLKKGRYFHGSIKLGNDVMIIGGAASDERLGNFFDFFLIIDFFSDLETEIWNFTNESNKVVNPILPSGNYDDGIGLYLVPFNFCTT